MRNSCHYCSRRVVEFAADPASPDRRTIDHYRPKAIRAHNEPEERVISCQRCNSMKGSTPPEVFEKYFELFGHAGLNNGRAYRLFCYRLMLAGLRYDRVEQSMREDFPWMVQSDSPAKRKNGAFP